MLGNDEAKAVSRMRVAVVLEKDGANAPEIMWKPILGEIWERSIWRQGTPTAVLSQRAVSYYPSRETSVCWKCDMKLPTIPLCPRINLAALHHPTVAGSFRWGGDLKWERLRFAHWPPSVWEHQRGRRKWRGEQRGECLLEEWHWAEKNFVRDDRLGLRAHAFPPATSSFAVVTEQSVWGWR